MKSSRPSRIDFRDLPAPILVLPGAPSLADYRCNHLGSAWVIRSRCDSPGHGRHRGRGNNGVAAHRRSRDAHSAPSGPHVATRLPVRHPVTGIHRRRPHARRLGRRIAVRNLRCLKPSDSIEPRIPARLHGRRDTRASTAQDRSRGKGWPEHPDRRTLPTAVRRAIRAGALDRGDSLFELWVFAAAGYLSGTMILCSDTTLLANPVFSNKADGPPSGNYVIHVTLDRQFTECGSATEYRTPSVP